MRFLLAFLITFYCFSPVYAMSLGFGDVAPNWTLPTDDNEALEYYPDSEGKVSVILFWATWCPYCAKLMPHLQKVYDKYRDKGLRLYAVDVFEDDNTDPIQYYTEKGYTFNLLLYGDSVAELYGVEGTPGLFVVNKNKKIIYLRKSGAGDEEVEQDLIELIGEEIQ